MSKVKVLITCGQMQKCLPEILKSFPLRGFEFHLPPLDGQMLSAAQMRPLLSEVEFAIVGDDIVNESSIPKNHRLRGVVKWGVGIDAVDVAALEERGIKFSNTPNQFAVDVAEYAIALMLAAERGLLNVDEAVRSGSWLKYSGRRVEGKSALILGFGNIGRRLASKLLALGLTVSAFDKHSTPTGLSNDVDLMCQFPKGKVYDYLFSCLPLSSDTYHFINRDRLAVLDKNGVFINVSRGGVVDEHALLNMLRQGQIKGAGLDVYEQEPVPSGSDFVALDNVVLGAHNASNTEEGSMEASIAALRILSSWIEDNNDS